jgi:hypothetical protein
MRRRLRGGGDPSDDTTEQQEDTNKKREPMDETAGHHVPQRLSRVAGRWEDLKTPPYTQEDEKRWAEQAEIDRKEREAKIGS